MDNVNNLSQTEKTKPSELKNDYNPEMDSMVYSRFTIIGRVFEELYKVRLNQNLLVCYTKLAVKGGFIITVQAKGIYGEQMATIYKQGDFILVDGIIETDENGNIILYVKEHRLLRKNVHHETVTDYENIFTEIEELYDPYNVSNRMKEEFLKGEDDKND